MRTQKTDLLDHENLHGRRMQPSDDRSEMHRVPGDVEAVGPNAG